MKDGDVVAQLSTSRLSTPSLKLTIAPTKGGIRNSDSKVWIF